MAADDIDPKAATLAAATQGAHVSAMTLTSGDPRAAASFVSGSGAPPGKFFAHYRIEKPIGKGGMGEVYLATDVTLDRQVALKLLPRDTSGSPDRRERFLREARAQARLSHPNICHIYFIGEEDDQMFFAMELIDGESLQERLDRDGKIPAGEAIDLCRMAALGLREAHRHGFIHRDIKPSNLIVDRHGVLKLVDFGIVKGKDADDAIVGTPLYMSPEQARGDEVDFRTDVYSLGVTLHHMLSGQPPFSGTTAHELASRHEADPRPRLGKETRSANRTLVDALCDRMMAKRPADRFASYDELLATLDRLSPSVTRTGGFWVRGFAALLDFIIIAVILVPIPLLARRRNVDVPDAALVAIAMAYYTIAHARWGHTFGKRALEIEVVPENGLGRIGWVRSFGRSLVQAGLPLAGTILEDAVSSVWGHVAATSAIAIGVLGFGAVFMIFPAQRTLWDRLSGTRVVYKRLRA